MKYLSKEELNNINGGNSFMDKVKKGAWGVAIDAVGHADEIVSSYQEARNNNY
ncbi:bacteriocin [Staphylococcus haemolyticus]|uniref:bacteriocin n=1 Tax=Staphylococcus haemolyticus TaxID=1283 RepID=UPI003CFB4C21